MTVVLIGEGDRREFDLLREAIADRGGEAVFWDTRDWPGERSVGFDVGAGTVTVGRTYDVAAVSGVFAWSNHLFDLRQRRFVEEFDELGLEGIYRRLDSWRGFFGATLPLFEANGATVFTPLAAQHYHDTKPLQLSRFERASVPTPETLVTNDPDRVDAFVREQGEVIFKPLTQGAAPQRLTVEDLDSAPLERLGSAPVQFQEYVPGEDLRVYVLDDEIVGASRYVTDEWTIKNLEEDPADAESVELRPEIRRAVETATETTPFRFGAFDVRATEESFAVLEANTDPRFAFHDVHGATDVAGALAAALL